MKQSTGPTAYRARSFFLLLFAGGMLLGPLATGAGAIIVIDPAPTVRACVVANGAVPGTVFTVAVADPGRPAQTLSVPAGGCASTAVTDHSAVTLTQIAPDARIATIQVDPPDRLLSAQPSAARVTVKTADYGDNVGVTFVDDCKNGNAWGDTKHCRSATTA